MHQIPWERPQGQDLEPSSRAPSQARIYLEQIQKRVTLIGQDRVSSGKIQTGKRDYLVDAAKQIRQALDKEVNEDYEAAFNFYKNGVDLLLKGIQVDSNGERREAVKRKITQYLKRAEDIFNCHLQKGIGSSACQSEGFSSFRFRPIRILSSPVEYLKSCKVVGVIDKVLLAQDPSLGETFIVKSLCKSNVETRNQQTIIPQGVPYMVRLLRYYVSEDAIFLHLEYVPGHVCLTYFGQWGDIEPHCSSRAVEDLFCAPELSGICEVTEACDWWSLGAILYELLTGVPLSHSYPSGINSSTPLRIPDNLSMAATSLLTELLQYDATYRLGTGVDGANEIKAHPFFSSVQWGNLTT